MRRVFALCCLLTSPALGQLPFAPGQTIKLVRDTDICPNAEVTALVASLRDSAPNQAASYASRCALAFTADTLKAINSPQTPIDFQYVGAFSDTVIIVMAGGHGAPFPGALDTQPLHTVGFAYAPDFAPVTH